MLVKTLDVAGFRNLAALEIGFDPGPTVIVGPNGAGKTNLLEALYTGLAGRSFRTRSEREPIALGGDGARIRVQVTGADGEHTFAWSASRAEGTRVLLDGSAATGEQAQLRPPLAVFHPDRLILVKGPPAGRRAHLDSFAAALFPARVAVRRRYARALAQRNRLLSGGGTDGLDAWDGELAAAGSELIEARTAAADALAGPFAELAARLGLSGDSELNYRPSSKAASAAELEAELREARASDLERGFTTRGPHRDELRFAAAGRPLRRFGSQGQQRIAVLALLFAERRALSAAGRPASLMLLDDVMSELDSERRRLLVELIEAGEGQALITATDATEVPGQIPQLRGEAGAFAKRGPGPSGPLSEVPRAA